MATATSSRFNTASDRPSVAPCSPYNLPWSRGAPLSTCAAAVAAAAKGLAGGRHCRRRTRPKPTPAACAAGLTQRVRNSLTSMPPSRRAVPWSERAVSALCFGINTYSSLEPLKNCEADAKAFAEQVRSLPDGGNSRCVATVRTGAQLKSKADMEKAVREFVMTIDKGAPPRMVAITFSGHGIQVGEDILMLPSEVSSEPHEVQKEGFSHNELFTILCKEVHKKTHANDVYYLLIIDACRETPQEPAVGFLGTLDPLYRDAVGEEAMRWALCAGTSRGSPAADAGTLDASHLGAFTSCVISENAACSNQACP